MKILVVGDIHWSTYSSIMRSRGNNFSTRLEYLIKSLNWVEQVSREYGCEEEVFLGDFFDKPDLTSEEISALSEINWGSGTRLRHFLVGNHDSGVASLIYNSTQVLHRLGVVEDTPRIYPLDDKTEFLLLPYVTEDGRKPLGDYLKDRNPNKKLIVFSHNDIKDFQMGMFLSKTGYAISDIEANCDLYINGHLHNWGWVSPNKILNLGNLCGQNFSEDAFKYEHHVGILDTDTLKIEFIKNPYALNFYKLDIATSKDLSQIKMIGENAVVSVKCTETLRESLIKELESNPPLLYKIIYTRDAVQESGEESLVELNNKDHLEQFREYILDTLGSSAIVRAELQEVCK